MRILQSTPLRLTVALVVLFSAVSLVSLGVSYLVARSTVEATIRSALVQEVTVYRAAPNALALRALVQAQAEAMRPEDKIVAYVDPLGGRVGNGAIVRTSEGFEAVALSAEDNVARTYFALTEKLHGGYLTLAASADARAAMLQTMLIVLTVSLGPTVLIALLAGLWMARRTARRIEAMDSVLNRISAGDLAARMAEQGGLPDDLTRIAGRIDQMAAALQANVAALRRVSSDIAHDLKTPIQRLALVLDDASKAEGPRQRDLVEKAIGDTEQIRRIFQALLQIARIEGGSPRETFEPVALNDLVQSVVELYAPAAEDNGQTLTASIEATPVIHGDRTLLGQALANLIENALRHAGAGAAITVSLTPGAITVADTGPGVPEDERANILRPLYRLDESRSTPGAGLGLSMVAAISELHGLDLSLEDNAPGLRVVLGLPTVASPGQTV